MTSVNIYLDESGDLGWTLDRPYRAGGSSQFLTLAAVLVAKNQTHLPKRVIRRIYDKLKRDPVNELKWVDLSHAVRVDFCTQAAALAANPKNTVALRSITVRKANVQPHIRADANKLYNYMIGCLLLDEMAKFDEVTFIPDPRSVKVKSGNSLHDYLQTQLWFERGASTKLRTQPADSMKTTNIQFADMLCGAIQSYHEDGFVEGHKLLRPCMECRQLFF